jgi:adenine-specific DNA-methyltransferase
MTDGLSSTLDAIRSLLNGRSCRDDRSKIGQFLTPASIAEFMASLFEGERENVRILDAGAGAGVLFAACVEKLLSVKPLPVSIEAVAFENDERVLPYLKETFEQCESICRGTGVSFRGEVRAEDFIAAAIAQTEGNLFTAQRARFTHAILNPPYRKIHGQSTTRKMLDRAGIGISNLYAAFVWLAALLLEPGGELVAITPRSFCNGPYFRQFRVKFLYLMSLRHIHVFDSRKRAFRDDDVLQENVIYHGVRGGPKPEYVTISSSDGANFDKISRRPVTYEHVVLPGDRDVFIRLVLNEFDDTVMERMKGFETSLLKLGLEVSTGRVVDFRAQNYLRPFPEDGTAPLIHPCHFEDGFIHWPSESGKKFNAILSSTDTRELMLMSGYYVLTKRFTAKEERRRVVAAVYDPYRIDAPFVGFENHLNYYHARGKGLPPNLAKGLAMYLNSTLFDKYFRLFSGHTQVNATDLRKMRYPSLAQLLRCGAHVGNRMPDQETVDTILEKECQSNA